MHVGIYFSKPYPYPFHKAEYLQAYLDLAKTFYRAGLAVTILRPEDEYQFGGKFSSGYRYQAGQFIGGGAVEVDLIFNKGAFPYRDIPVFNSDFVTEACGNKWFTYQKFVEFSPQTWLIESIEDFNEVVTQNSGQKLVRKPIDGSEGFDIQIDTAEKMKPIFYPFLMQKLLDSSGGVPGIVAGTHDFRVAILDGEIVYSYVRTPPPGSLVANVAQGGTFTMIPIAEIPTVFRPIIEEVDAYMSAAPHRFYGIDMALTPAGPKIIELNSQLGILPDSDHPDLARVKQKLAQVMKEIILERV